MNFDKVNMKNNKINLDAHSSLIIADGSIVEINGQKVLLTLVRDADAPETNDRGRISKQTAVEWLVSQLNKDGFAPVVTDEEIAQAKAMEKEQMINIGSHCFARGHKGFQPIESDAEHTAE